MRTTLAMLAVVGLLVILGSGTAMADQLTFNFTGTLATPFNNNNTVAGQFTLDTSTPDAFTGAADSVSAFNISTPFSTNPAAVIDPADAWSGEVLTLTALNPNQAFVDVFFRGPAGGILILLFETDLSPFDGSTFFTGPITIPNGSGTGTSTAFSRLDCGSLGTPACSEFLYDSAFTSGGATPVPEPSALLLLGAGLLGLLPMARRRVRLV